MGGASTTKVRSSNVGAGGVYTSGSAYSAILIRGTGGVFAGGSATVSSTVYSVATGGAISGGSSISKLLSQNISNGGSIANGTSFVSAKFATTSSGGVVVSGSVKFGDFLYGSGGVAVGGSSQNYVTLRSFGQGGCVSAGASVVSLSQTEIATDGISASGISNIWKVSDYNKFADASGVTVSGASISKIIHVAVEVVIKKTDPAIVVIREVAIPDPVPEPVSDIKQTTKASRVYTTPRRMVINTTLRNPPPEPLSGSAGIKVK